MNAVLARVRSTLHLFVPLLAFATYGCEDESISGLKVAAKFEPESVDFGDVTVGTSARRPVELKNTGSVPFTIVGLELPPSFSLRAEKGKFEGTDVPVGQALVLDAIFLAADVGEKSGTIILKGEVNEAKLEVRANGVVRMVPELVVEPASIDFGTVEVGAQSRLPITIKNNGNAEGTVTRALLESSGGLGDPYALSGALPALIPAGGSQAFEVVFQPTSEGPKPDRMVFEALAPAGSVTLQISGTAAVARGGLSCSPSTIAFGAVQRGQTKSETVTCSASGGITRFISAAFPPAETLFVLPAPPGTADLVTGQSVTFAVEFRAEGSPVPHNSQLAVQFNGANGTETLTIPVTGEVTPPPVTSTAMSILLRWDSNFTDVDLHLVRPGGALWSATGECSYLFTAPDWGIASDPTDNPFLDVDDTDGRGPENINLNVAAPGNYEVWIHYYDDNGFGASQATVEVYIGGNLAGTYNRRISCNDMWHVGTIVWDGAAGTFAPSTQVQRDAHGACF
ncbi:MAG: choice-of-anchor D domain-containing protein [Deltaproteobacteria bacterium]|nr:choice-of-anchor D domain-containing protein [Deltaproteobacteria bacterium]